MGDGRPFDARVARISLQSSKHPREDHLDILAAAIFSDSCAISIAHSDACTSTFLDTGSNDDRRCVRLHVDSQSRTGPRYLVEFAERTEQFRGRALSCESSFRREHRLRRHRQGDERHVDLARSDIGDQRVRGLPHAPNSSRGGRILHQRTGLFSGRRMAQRLSAREPHQPDIPRESDIEYVHGQCRYG